ncbi:hypothetical protein [Actinoplanes subtropicus]|uniref:hypothetical protein n=1 Tax=Actinoplanes subtropicus TaxID=543632 RepID=UPI000A043330|nr:hypothetical protein [Actinoplanes subtropicus]
MMTKSRKLTAAALVVPATVALVVAGTASAASATTGSPSGAPPAADNANVWCVSTTGAKACFAAYGDYVWVKDTKANGESAAGTIQGHNWARQCFNDRGAAGGWVKCDFDVPEYESGLLWAVNNPFIGSQASTAIYTSNPI